MLAGPANQPQPIRPAGAMQQQPLQECVASTLPPWVVTDNHISWYTHRHHLFGSSSARFSANRPHQPIRIRRRGHKRWRAGPTSSPGDRTGETTRIRASRRGWKGRILASIPARPTTRAHATQAPPQLRGYRRGWIKSRSVAPAGWPVPGRASGAPSAASGHARRLPGPPPRVGDRWRHASTLPQKRQ